MISGLWDALYTTHSNSTKSGVLHIIASLGENQFDSKRLERKADNYIYLQCNCFPLSKANFKTYDFILSKIIFLPLFLFTFSLID